MATEVIDGERVPKFFDHLEEQKSILSTCTNLYKTLISHFSALDKSLSQRSQTLDSKIKSLQAESQEALSSLDQREQSIPDHATSISADIESLKKASLAHFDDSKPKEDIELVDTVKSFCRGMDSSGLLRFLVSNRREAQALNIEIADALRECVDPPRLVLDLVELFVTLKRSKSSGGGGGVGSGGTETLQVPPHPVGGGGGGLGGGLADRRMACGMVVSGLFPSDELKKAWMNKKMKSFAGRLVEKAKSVIQVWIEKVEENGGVMKSVGPAEVATFLQLIIGFGLKDEFNQGFLKKMALEFGVARRDMSKLAVPVFGEKIGDTVDELLKNGKDIQAIYFAHEAGLTGRHQAISLLRTYMNQSKALAVDAEERGNMDESIHVEMTAAKAIIRSVEELGLEEQFTPLTALKRRLTALDKQKTERKSKSSTSTKRAKDAGSSRASTQQPPPRPPKAARTSKPQPSRTRRNPTTPPSQTHMSRYPAPYNYPAQPVGSYTSVYGGTHASPSSLPPPQHYPLPTDSTAAGSGGRLSTSSIYGGQSYYGSYDTAAPAPAPAPAYQPPTFQYSYTQ